MQYPYPVIRAWCILLCAAFALPLSAQTEQELFQGFEGNEANPWNFTASPAAYSLPDIDDVWGISNAVNDLSPASGTAFWYMRDLDNPNGGNDGFHTLDFDAVDVSSFVFNTVSFKYYSFGYEDTDSIGYIIETAPGSGFDMSNYVALDGDTQGWQTVFVNLPAGIPTVRLRLMAKQNGGNDYAGFDDIAVFSSVEDFLPPIVLGAELLGENSIRLTYSEPMDVASVENPLNYTTANGTIASIVYSAPGGMEFPFVTITYTEPFLNGQANSLSPGLVTDEAGNFLLEAFTFDWIYNDATPNLVITEILYNPPGSDDLEFIEILNAGNSPAPIGGLQVNSGFSFTFPELELPAGGIVLLAQNEAEAEAFFGMDFYDWGNGEITNGDEEIAITNFSGTLIDTVNYLDESPWPAEADGNGPSIELLDAGLDNNQGANWYANTIPFNGTEILATPGSFTPAITPVAAFADSDLFLLEGQGAQDIIVTLANPNSLASTLVVNVSPASTAIAGEDYTLSGDTLTFAGSTGGDLTLPLQVLDNSSEGGRYLILELSALENAEAGSDNQLVILIQDNDYATPQAPVEPLVRLSHLGSFASGEVAEIVAHDPATQRLFVTNSATNTLDVIDFSNPAALSNINSIDMSAYGGGINSVAVQNGLVAVAMEAEVKTDNGSVVFFDADGTFLGQAPAGALPDMVVFSPDGTKVLTANEGEPNDDYTIDPEGSVTIIDLSAGAANLTAADAATVSFASFNAQEAELKTAGVRIFGPGATVAQDLEPEFITLSADGNTAYVSCQENNAFVLVDMATATATAVRPLGYKDWSESGPFFDASNRTEGIFFANWPVKSAYMPDAVQFFEAGGQGYIITANEGDARDYNGFTEEFRIGDDEIVLDPGTFPFAEALKNDQLLGRLRITAASGDTDGDGDFDEIVAYGGRSFSIFDAASGALVYDSGSELERVTAADPLYGTLFNSDNEENSFKNRSDDKGPEPEAVRVAEINGRLYAFIALERTGGLVLYDVTNPAAPQYLQYLNTRTIETEGGDLGPEDIQVIDAANSPNGKPLVIVSNEISGTIGVFELQATPTVEFAEGTLETFEGIGFETIAFEVTNPGDLPGTIAFTIASASTAEFNVDYRLTELQLQVPAGSTAPITFDLEILDNSHLSGRYLILEADPANSTVQIGEESSMIVLISDTDDFGPQAADNPAVQLSHSGSFALPNGGAAEIVAFDAGTQRLFASNSINNTLEILDFSNPAGISAINSIDLSVYNGAINSVAVYEGLVAVAMEASVKTDPGFVAFFDTDGNLLSTTTVGALPDMLVFTADGQTLLVANEGEPNDDYTIDPEGSVSLIDLSNGPAMAMATTVGFSHFNGDEATLSAQGVRIFGPGATVAQDLEPEYITLSNDGSTAYVACQENNAIIQVDLASAAATGILPLGYKDWAAEGATFDASNRTDEVFFSNWPVKGMYQPDAVSFFNVGGQGYIITANEGDARDYDGYTEEFRIGDDEIVLDADAFPHAEYLKEDVLLGRLRITAATGDTDGDGDFDELYAYGGRSFSIFDAASGALVYDSGNEMEQITANDFTYGGLFNSDNEENSFKNRSDDKGPEPEAVVVAEIDGRPYGFIGMERVGGILAYDLSDPAAPQFLQYINTRTLDTEGGDLGPEDLIFVSSAESPDGKAYILAAYEISGTIGVFELQRPSTVEFAQADSQLDEGAGTIQLELSVAEAGGIAGTAQINVLSASTAVEGEDFTLASATVTFDGSAASRFVSLDILDNSSLGGRYLVLEIDADGSSVMVGSNNRHILLINDNDDMAPVAAVEPYVQLSHLGSYFTGGGEGTAEIVAYDGAAQRLFLTNSNNQRVDILDYSDPANVALVSSIDITLFGDNVNSVAVYEGLVAVAIEGAGTADNGMVGFFDTDGVFISSVTVGVLPDMVTFSPDGTKVLTANEGEPNDDYTVDPEGSVSIIDLSNGPAAATVATATFEAFNGQADALRAAGVRIFGPGATVAQDMEPEYITLSEDGTTAYVACQENNALAIVDLATQSITEIRPLGFKDWTAEGVTFDASDRTDGIFFANWPVKGVYHPDAISYFTAGGEGYIITTNEGDARDYDGYTEEFRVKDDEIVLDPTAFPDADLLKEDVLMGRLRITAANGDTDGDGDYDELYAYGGRSFSIFNAATGALVYDSGNDLEQITANDPVFGALFNTTNDENDFKNRSDDKGPEPEAVAVAEIDGSTYAFIGLERVGGIMVYDISNPAAPVYLQYINTRTVETTGGDLGPEGIAFIPASASPDGKPLLAVSNEISGSVAMFELGLNCPVTGLPATVAICEGESATLEITGTYEEIIWSNGDMGELTTVTAAGTYTVMATTDGGCMAADTVVVEVNPLPAIELGEDLAICENEAATLDAGAGFEVYAWSNGAVSPSITIAESGTYSVTVTNAEGCTNTDSITVSVNPLPMANFPMDTVICVEQAYTFDPGMGNLLLINGEPVESFSTEGLEPGAYNIEAVVTNGFGCELPVVLSFVVDVCNSTRDLLTEESFSLFPNPTTGKATIELGRLQGTPYELSVVTVAGQAVQLRQIPASAGAFRAQIDLSGMPAGVYLVRLSSEAGTLTRRLIVE